MDRDMEPISPNWGRGGETLVAKATKISILKQNGLRRSQKNEKYTDELF
jgi:hypothetical protein